MTKHRIFTRSFASVYVLYVQKVERKNHAKEEVDTIICWLIGYDIEGLQRQIEAEVGFETFFKEAAAINPNSTLITVVICKVRVESIEDHLRQQIRYLDTLIDELARGKKLDKILRS